MHIFDRKAENNVGWQARELQGIVSRLFRRSRADQDATSPEAQISEAEREAAVDREGARLRRRKQ